MQSPSSILMSQKDPFERIVASLHEAMLDEANWLGTSALIDEALGAKGNLLVVGDDSSRRQGALFARFCYRGEHHNEWEREYYCLYYPVDEHLPRLRSLPDSRIVHVTDVFSERELKTSPVFNEAMARTHNQNSLKVRMDGPENSRIFWTIADPIDSGGWSSAQTDLIERLLPHVRQFVRVRHALVESGALGRSLTELLGNTRAGVIQLDRHGRIAAANDRAGEILRQEGGLSDQNGFLSVSSPKENTELQGILARALPPFGVQGTSGSMVLTGAGGAPPTVVHVTPVDGSEADFRTWRIAALVLITDPNTRVPIESETLEEALGLTPAEAVVAAMLAEGRTAVEIAKTTGRGESTVRWHIKRIFEKLGFTRQMELVLLVLSITTLPLSPR